MLTGRPAGGDLGDRRSFVWYGYRSAIYHSDIFAARLGLVLLMTWRNVEVEHIVH